MSLKCFMLLAFCIVGAVPIESLPKQNLTNASSNSSSPQVLPYTSHYQPQPQRHLLRKTPRTIPSSKTAPAKIAIPPTTHKSAKRVEDYAKQLRDDMEAQERVLNAFIATIKTKHEKAQLKLSRVKNILKGLKAEIANATKYADEFAAEDTDQSKQAQIIQDEYEKSAKMFSDERENIEFEKKFLEEIIKYIQLRKSNCKK
jgi:hypothetical protein